MVRILFIDDDPKIHAVLEMALPGECAVIPAMSGGEGIRLVEEEDPDLVLLDIGLPDMDGMEVLRQILALPSPPPVIMVTARGETETVVEAIKAGAHDYIVKPITREKVYSIVHTAVRVHLTDDPPADESSVCHMIGSSPAMRNVKRLVALYATSHSPVLIVGETGTGKELVAQTIHALSARHGEVYIPINCGAIPETLLETELFGAERGAFTDATTRPGVFERAHRGTLFLDEIGEMPVQQQVKLLRVIEERAFTRVGGIRRIESDVRFIAATNRALSGEVDGGRFRRDLYYRINTLPLSVPPLRSRRADIPELARAFVKAGAGDRPASLTSTALEKLMGYRWPGNIRELRNVIERAQLFARGGRIEARHIVFD